MTNLAEVLKELRELDEKATKGPWQETICRSYQELPDGFFHTVFGQGPVHEEAKELKLAILDMTLISKTRNYLPGLLQVIEKQREALEFYSKRGNYCMAVGTLLKPIDDDERGNIARETLAFDPFKQETIEK